MVSEQITLDRFTHRPLTKRTEKFMEVTELYKEKYGRYPESFFQVEEFIHEVRLPWDLRHFKLLSESQIKAAFWKCRSSQVSRTRANSHVIINSNEKALN